MALLQQCSPPERIMRTYPMALPERGRSRQKLQAPSACPLAARLSLTDLTDELPELVQVALPVRSEAQLPDAAVKLLRSLKRVLRPREGAESTEAVCENTLLTLFKPITPKCGFVLTFL